MVGSIDRRHIPYFRQLVIRIGSRIQGYDCKRKAELSNWCCNSSSEHLISIYKKNLENITLISPPTVYIGRYSIVARITECACGNSMHFLSNSYLRAMHFYQVCAAIGHTCFIIVQTRYANWTVLYSSGLAQPFIHLLHYLNYRKGWHKNLSGEILSSNLS